MFNKIFISLIVGGVFSSNTYALSLQESLVAANIYNAEINAARSVHDADNQKKYQGFAGLLPVISLNGAWNKTDQPDATYSAGVTRHNYSFNVTQPIFDISKYADWKKTLVIGDLADVNYLIAQQKLISDVVTAWYDVLYQRSVLETSKRVQAAFNVQLKQSHKALELGDGTHLDEAEAQANYDKSVADVLAAENDLNDASVVFRQLTGLDAQSIPGEDMGCLRFTGALDLEKLKRATVANNLNILAAIQTLKASETDIVTATSNHLPVVTFQAGYGKNWSRAENSNALDDLFGTTSKTDNTTFGLNVSIPLFAGGSQISQSLEAAHRFEQSKDLLIDARRKAEQQTIQAASGVKNNEARINAYKRAISSSEKRLSSTRYGREIGQRTLIDVFNAEKEYYQAIQDLAQAQNKWIQSVVKLSSSTGALDYSVVKNFSCGAA
ncbi:TolC family outer membrane protein [Hafnia psychrotolerans]|jgi:outer membrane protein|uniref:Outer membrane protein n=1 Tax=Hafnia psychrotolerans TaxID=1477018 RepID=A0ABQ1GX23_9GAMM|nr:TolC family outer membrane protein [Hafnia psychrotolerans]GGA51696.1 outer membrane protein [Hafnia psychrotolerans]